MCARNDRISSARRYLERCDAQALVFFGLANIRYLTGFTGSDGVAVVTGERGWFLTDSRYTMQASQEVTGFEVQEYRGKIEGLSALLNEVGAARVCFDADQATVAFIGKVEAAVPHIGLIPLSAELDDFRIIKGPAEVDLLQRAADIASAALMDTLPLIKPGAVERDIALALEFAMKRAGAEEKSFDFIVASGPRGALPHGRASDRSIGRGELVTIDFGAVYRGYNSDETVTVAVGAPDLRQQEIYTIVKDAHDRAVSAVRPGVSLRELDGIARDYIDGKGYGRYFGHGLGHGVGLEVHEKPVVSPKGEGVVEAGMVLTIEPGIYIPEWGGVRIEDTVLVEDDGCRLLTKVPKELMVL